MHGIVCSASSSDVRNFRKDSTSIETSVSSQFVEQTYKLRKAVSTELHEKVELSELCCFVFPGWMKQPFPPINRLPAGDPHDTQCACHKSACTFDLKSDGKWRPIASSCNISHEPFLNHSIIWQEERDCRYADPHRQERVQAKSHAIRVVPEVICSK
jgi:hypothetical protein